LTVSESDVYFDQIWKKSGCRTIENNTYQELKKVSSKYSFDIEIQLVDVLPNGKLNAQLIITDNKIIQYPNKIINLFPEFWGSFYYEPVYENCLPKKDFSCFINRVCIFRQSWFYQFLRRNLITSGHISYLLDYRDKIPDQIKNKIDLNDWIFSQGNEIFREEHEKIRFDLPFKNFSMDIESAILDSKVHLIIETYFDNNNVISLSEKIFRGLQLPRPFILFCAKNTIDFLKEHGFKVFDQYIDHSYDDLESPIERQISILDQLHSFKNVIYTNEMLVEFEDIACYNRKLLKQYRDRYPQKLKSVIEEIESLNKMV